MSSTPLTQPEPAEAVIISGPRKGEFIRLGELDPDLAPAEEALLDQLVEAAQRMAESARAAAVEADLLLQDRRAAQAP
jgi:hypothetical protein